MTRYWQPLLQLIARACLGLVFLSSAAGRVRDFHLRCDALLHEGVQSPEIVLGCWIGLAVMGGLSVALGWRSRFGLSLLMLCTLMGMLLEPPPVVVALRLSLSPLAGNLALLSALAALMTSGPGPWSFDARSASTIELGDSNVLG